MQRDGAGCSVGIKCSLHKSQMSFPALAFSPSPWWGAVGPVVPVNPLSGFTLSKALPCNIRLLVILVFRVAMSSNLMVKVLLFVYTYTYNSLGLTCTQILSWFSYIYSFPAVQCPKFNKPSISCYILLYWNKMPILQGNGKLIQTQLYANTIVFCVEKFYWSFTQSKTVLKKYS